MLNYTKIKDVKDPTGNREEDAGYDFYIPADWNNSKPMKLYIGEQVNIPSGIKVILPHSTMLTMFNKSGVALKKGLTVGACIIDESYRGEIHLNLFKVVKGTQDEKDENGFYTVLTPGEKIVQGVICPIINSKMEYINNEEYDNMPKTSRDSGGFGSTGVN